jgi:hypothetical protein
MNKIRGGASEKMLGEQAVGSGRKEDSPGPAFRTEEE